jgi:CRISPR system Cascade subunit CasC
MILEVHLIQSFAPSCLNRDDTNTPKSCLFGGFRRARISSQCLKRAMRLHMRDVLGMPTGTRTRLLSRHIGDLLMREYGRDREAAESRARLALQGAGFAHAADAPERTNVGLYLSEDEIRYLANAIHSDWDELTPHETGADSNGTTDADTAPGRAGESAEALDAGREARAASPSAEPRRRGRPPKRSMNGAMPAAVKGAIDAIGPSVAVADIALFGRMVAQNAHMEVDAAAQVAHAISTHEVDTEMDFFTAVDDLHSGTDRGVGMMGVMEFQSACFYRYATLHRDQLLRNLGLDADLARRTMASYVRAAIEAIPSGRQHGCAALNLPEYVQVSITSGMPRSLANAFERPVRPGNATGPISELSIRRLEEYQAQLDAMYGRPDPGTRRRSATLPSHSDGDVASLLNWVEQWAA